MTRDAGSPNHLEEIVLQTQSNIMLRLRNDTTEHHKRAESNPLERALVKGAISRAQFAAYLSQRYLIHRDLDAHIKRLTAHDDRLATIVPDELYQTPRLAADLTCFGVNLAAISPAPAASRLIADIDAAARELPASTLGAFYVFEGSKNGARYICRAVRPALNLSVAGTSYLDPHGEQQPVLWAAFKARMDAVDFTEAEQSSMVALACCTFDRIAEIDEQLWSSHRE